MAHIRETERTKELNLLQLVVDGGRSVPENAAIIQKHFHLS